MSGKTVMLNIVLMIFCKYIFCNYKNFIILMV